MTNENLMIDLPRGKLRYTLTNDFLFLKAGEEYINVLKTIHISILDFTPQNFPAKLYTDYYMYNKENNHIYSDKLRIVMLQLNQLGNPEDEKLMPDLYYWAQLFKATTWEEIGMLAEKSEDIRNGIVTLKALSEDEKIRQQCEGRERYRMDMFAATNKGYCDGEAKGLALGRAEGAEQMAKLVKILIDNESYDELKQIDDENYRSYLFEKYKIEHKFGKSIDR